ncbi:MAG: hypothetical protein ACTSWI_06930 [Alphaproteobacteria bacterium]
MNRGQSEDIRSLYAEIIPPRQRPAPRARPARVIDVHPEFLEPLAPAAKSTGPSFGYNTVRVWAACGIGLAAIAIALLMLRGPIVERLPLLSGAYRAVGIPMAPVDLALEDVQVVRVYSRGWVSLRIEGSIANPTGRQLDIPPMSLFVRGPDGLLLRAIALTPFPTRLDPGGVAQFALDVNAPPENTSALAIQIGDGPEEIVDFM